MLRFDRTVTRHPLGYYELAHKPSQAELSDYYARQYYQSEEGSYSKEYTSFELAYIEGKISQRWNFISKYFRRPGALIDIGCGEGFSLSFFSKLGWSVRGVDFSSLGIEQHNPSMLDFFESGDIFEALSNEHASGRRYDLVWLQNVLEHVIDPIELLNKLRSLTTPHGYLVVTVPNDFSDLQSKALEGGAIDSDFWVVPPDHLSYFNYESIHKLANTTGWTCAGILADFPIDWLLFNPSANCVRDKSKGKHAHQTRLTVESVISKQPVEKVNKFYEALASLGMGRNITAFLTPS